MRARSSMSLYNQQAATPATFLTFLCARRVNNSPTPRWTNRGRPQGVATQSAFTPRPAHPLGPASACLLLENEIRNPNPDIPHTFLHFDWTSTTQTNHGDLPEESAQDWTHSKPSVGVLARQFSKRTLIVAGYLRACVMAGGLSGGKKAGRMVVAEAGSGGATPPQRTGATATVRREAFTLSKRTHLTSLSPSATQPSADC